MAEVLGMQKVEANVNFSKFYIENYQEWLNNPNIAKPTMSHRVMQERVFPQLDNEGSFFFIVIDNLRYDQWKTLEPIITNYFEVEEQNPYYSILPTTTSYARNTLFSGLLPSEMEKKHPDLWLNDNQEGGKNNYEFDFLKHQLKRNLINIKSSYHKIIMVEQGKAILEKIHNLMNNKLNVLVYNFVDMLSHARTDTAMVRELTPDEAAYRSLTKSWFMYSPLLDVLKILSDKGAKVIITTDHGTIRTKRPYKIIGDKNTNTNLRYKQGKNLSYDPKNVFTIKHPEKYFLPKINVSSAYVFTKEDYFFAYPNNFNHYVKYYKDTFQHGGISLEEVIIPFVNLRSK